MIEKAKAYIEDVLSGRETVGELVRLAVMRHVNDLKRQRTPDFPFYFDEVKAERAIQYLSALRHPSGAKGIAKQRFKIQNNQAFITACLFGWRRSDTGGRRFTKGYLEVARKWGKSLWAAFVEMYVAHDEGVHGGGVFTAATTRAQADEVFRAAKKMSESLIRDSKKAKREIKVMANSIVFNSTGCFIQKVSSENGDIEGKNPACAVVDEYHDHQTDEVLELMASGMGTWDDPLLLIITTAGYNKEYPCFKTERPNAVSVLKGDYPQENLFTVIYCHDTEDADGILGMDPDDPEQAKEILRLAKKSNPNLGSTPQESWLLDRVREARNKGGTTRVRVLTKNFNCWTDAPTIWIPEEEIKAVMRPIAYTEFVGRPVFQGCDIGARRDMTARALFSPPIGDKPALLKVDYWVPQAAIAKREKDVAGYRYWSDDGFLRVTPGDIFDFEFVKKEIISAHSDLGAQKTRFDPWNSYQMMVELLEQGIDVGDCRPDYRNLNEPCKWIDQAIGGKLIEIDANPVLLWNFRNVVLDRNADDSVKPNKKRSGEKIDGISATLAAVFGWLTEPAETNVPYFAREGEKVLTL